MTVFEDQPPPLLPGWLVAYQGPDRRLRGGCDDRAHGEVRTCEWAGGAWTVVLTDRQRLPLRAIRSVGKVNAAGCVVSAWITEQHGFDGAGRRL
jgi:hypothetical protein